MVRLRWLRYAATQTPSNVLKPIESLTLAGTAHMRGNAGLIDMALVLVQVDRGAKTAIDKTETTIGFAPVSADAISALLDVPDTQLDRHALRTQITTLVCLGRLGDIGVAQDTAGLYCGGAQLQARGRGGGAPAVVPARAGALDDDSGVHQKAKQGSEAVCRLVGSDGRRDTHRSSARGCARWTSPARWSR